MERINVKSNEKPRVIDTIAPNSALTRLPLFANQIILTPPNQTKDKPEYKEPETKWLEDDPRVLEIRTDGDAIIINLVLPIIMHEQDLIAFINHRLQEGDEIQFIQIPIERPQQQSVTTMRLAKIISAKVEANMTPRNT